MSGAKRGPKGRFVNDAVNVDDTAKPVDGVVNGSGNPESEPASVNPADIGGSSEPLGDSGGDGGTDAGTGSDQPGEQPRRRRGRPPGSGTKNKTGSYPLNVRGLEKLLVGIHGGIGMLLSSPGFPLDTTQKVFDGKTEAEFMAQSIADVARHYNPQIFEQKTIDWSNLIQCLALVYGPRLYNLRAERKAARARVVNPAPTFNYGPRPVDPQPAANRAANAARNGHVTPVPPNDFNGPSDKEIRTGEIAGVGSVELPEGWLGMKPH